MEQIFLRRFVSSPTSIKLHHHFNIGYLIFSTETCASSYGKPDFAISKHCFSNLLATAVRANFLLLPLFTIRSYTSRHALLCLQALKAQRKSKLRSFLLPTLLILLRPRTLLPVSRIVGVIPT